MEVSAHIPLSVADRSHVAIARHETRHAAERVGFDESDAHRAGLVATELASNLVKHASGGGQILVRSANGAAAEVELIAIDCGPGMSDTARSLVDGYSTTEGSAGNGLGAIRRLADE